MSKTVKPIPDGYESLMPYLVVKDAARAIDFYCQIFGATELFRMDDKGRIGHAELQFPGTRLMLADEYPELGYHAPQPGELPPVGLMLYVEDVDAVVAHAVAAGATQERPVADQFYGDRTGGIVDPFGHRWYIATHIEDVSPEEMEQRAKAAR